MKYLLVFFIIIDCFSVVYSQPKLRELQVEDRNKGTAILARFAGGYQLSGGDLSNRFGDAGAGGIGADIQTANNWILGAEGVFQFGKKVKEDPVSILRTPEGDIIGKDQLLAEVLFKQRGFYAGIHLGKMLPFKTDTRSGIRLTLGGGWMQHKIKVQDNTRSVTQLTGDYAKGYDRLTAGPALTQSLSWQYLSPNRTANFEIGFDFYQGFTQTRRDWDFSERRKLEGKRLDLRYGIRLTWMLPFYLGRSAEIYY